MKKSLIAILITACLLPVGSTVLAQAYNPFTQNIAFSQEPSIDGFELGSTTSVKFTMGMTTVADAPFNANEPLKVKVTLDGFKWDGLSATSVVSGVYASFFNWSFDPAFPHSIIGTQNKALPGTGANPLAPNTDAAGLIELALEVPTTLAVGDALKVDVSLISPSYMQASNTTPDDIESTETVAFSTAAALPLEITSFDAKVINCNVLLSWTTSQELNTSHADVYRKDKANGFFNKIGTVSLAGNSETAQDYSFMDETAENQQEAYEYKLQFVDLDNTFTNSEVRTAKLDCSKGSVGVELFPNPASNQINFVYNTSSEDIQLLVEVLDMAGRSIRSTSKIIDNGSAMFTFDIRDIANGEYIVHYYSLEDDLDGSLKFTKK